MNRLPQYYPILAAAQIEARLHRLGHDISLSNCKQAFKILNLTKAPETSPEAFLNDFETAIAEELDELFQEIF